MSQIPVSLLKRLVRLLVHPLLLLLARRANVVVLRGVCTPDTAVDPTLFLDSPRWQVNLDYVRVGAAEMLRREIVAGNVAGSVAEVGVGEGAFAAVLNRLFPDRSLFLYDTFTGFDTRDVEVENQLGLHGELYPTPAREVEAVLDMLPHADRAEVRVGWFPESAAVDDQESFCLVNVDVGLYQPTRAALEWFWPRLEPGGFLLVTDYGTSHTPGVARAVREFADARGVTPVVLPDNSVTAVFARPRVAEA